MKLGDMFPERYVHGEDLGGKSFIVTIARVVGEKMRPNPGAPEELKYVVYTVEGKKGIILSRVLARQIAQITGEEDTDKWVGKRVKIFTEPVSVAGVSRIAIRARAAQ